MQIPAVKHCLDVEPPHVNPHDVPSQVAVPPAGADASVAACGPAVRRGHVAHAGAGTDVLGGRAGDRRSAGARRPAGSPAARSRPAGSAAARSRPAGSAAASAAPPGGASGSRRTARPRRASGSRRTARSRRQPRRRARRHRQLPPSPPCPPAEVPADPPVRRRRVRRPRRNARLRHLPHRQRLPGRRHPRTDGRRAGCHRQRQRQGHPDHDEALHENSSTFRTAGCKKRRPRPASKADPARRAPRRG